MATPSLPNQEAKRIFPHVTASMEVTHMFQMTSLCLGTCTSGHGPNAWHCSRKCAFASPLLLQVQGGNTGLDEPAPGDFPKVEIPLPDETGGVDGPTPGETSNEEAAGVVVDEPTTPEFTV